MSCTCPHFFYRTFLTQGAQISVNGIQFSNYFEEVICSNFESTSVKVYIVFLKQLTTIFSFSIHEKLLLITLDCINFVFIQGRKALENVLHKIKIEDILNALTDEIQELSTELDKATSKIDSEFHISARLQELSQDLDNATSMINSELQTFSDKLTLEFSNLVSKLNMDLHQITARINTTSENYCDLGLTAAVQNSGITAKKPDSAS